MQCNIVKAQSQYDHANVLAQPPNVSHKTQITCIPGVLACLLLEAIIGIIGWGIWRIL